MSPYILAMSMGVLACGIKHLSPWYMLFANDIVLCSTRSEEVEKKLRQGAEYQQKERKLYTRGSMYRNFDGNSDINIHGDNLERVTTFKYLVSTLAENGDLMRRLRIENNPDWKNWKRESGILCDRRISLRVKWKVYKTIVKPAMVYAAETWALK